MGGETAPPRRLLAPLGRRLGGGLGLPLCTSPPTSEYPGLPQPRLLTTGLHFPGDFCPGASLPLEPLQAGVPWGDPTVLSRVRVPFGVCQTGYFRHEGSVSRTSVSIGFIQI